MDYITSDFGVNSSSQFLFRAETHKLTDATRALPAPGILQLIKDQDYSLSHT